MKAKASWIGATAVLLVASFIEPIYLFEQSLQHGPTVLGLAALAVAARRDWLSTRAIAAICVFLWLHILGARYIYTYVPYDDWSEAIFGLSVSEVFGWRRNHYDRLVHLLFGVLACVPLYEAAWRYGGLSRGWSLLVAAMGVVTLSGTYEVFEWSLTLFVSPEQARLYNGQQGDIWDAQKDMALAMLGVLLFVARHQVRFWCSPNLERKSKKSPPSVEAAAHRSTKLREAGRAQSPVPAGR